jgi:hypothetical protein
MSFKQTNDREYVLSDEFYPWFQSHLRRRMLYHMVSVVVLSMAFSALMVPWHSSHVPFPVKLLLLLLTPVLFLIVWGIQFPRGITRQIEAFRSYRILISQDKVSRIQESRPDIILSRDEVTKIEEKPGQGVLVSGVNKYKKIWIPERISNYDDLRRQLSYLMPISRNERSTAVLRSVLSTILNTVIVLLGLALMLIFILIGGMIGLDIFLIVYIPITYLSVYRNPNVSRQAHKAILYSWIVAVLTLLWHVAKPHLLSR